MIINKATIRHFSEQGIVVKYYPDATYEDFLKRLYDEEVKYYFDYHKDTVAGCETVLKGHSDVCFGSNEELMQRAKEHADYCVYRGGGCRDKHPYEHTELYIEYDEGENHRVICQKVNVKSKEITIEYVDKLIAKDKKKYSGTFGKFADAMNRIVRELGYSSNLSVYPTTYGIGVWVFYNFSSDKDIEAVTNILKKNGVEYYNEYSEKMWVYRFKISKKQANIQLAMAV